MVREMPKIDCCYRFQTGRLAREEKTLIARAEDEPLDLDYAQNLWDGCFRAAVLKAAPSGSTTDIPDA
jgi:hypothetical protein